MVAMGIDRGLGISAKDGEFFGGFMQIIWDGCDGYINVETLQNSGRNFTRLDNGQFRLHDRATHHDSLDVREIAFDDVPLDDDGEQDFSGVFIVDGRYWVEVL